MATFGFVAMDQLMNQAAKITYMFGGQAKFPILYRMTVGTGMAMAAQHSINPYPMYMNIPGLKIILPSTPYDVKGLLKTGIRDSNPVIFFEHMGLGEMTGEVPQEDYTLPLGKASIKREGSDVTVIALAKMVHLSLEVAEEMKKNGISVEVIDPCSLIPLDRESMKASVMKTGRLVVVDEACRTCGTAGEIISSMVEDPAVFKTLKASPKRITGMDVPVPFSAPMENYVVPDKLKITSAIAKVMEG
jgi:pyruvate dehydrogenase E1 component beta subunit